MRLHSVWHWATFAALASGCASLGESTPVRSAAREDARAHIDQATHLLPAMPVTSVSSSRPQKPDEIVQVGFSNLPPADGTVAARIRAHVNGVPILEEEIREAIVQNYRELAAVPPDQRGQALRELATRELNRLIERELILEDAMARLKELKKPQIIKELQQAAVKESDRRLRDIKSALNVQTDAELRVKLQSEGLSLDGLRRQVERNFMMMEYVRNLIHPTVNRISLAQLREYYDDHPDEFRVDDRLKWQDIFIDASRHASPQAARQYAEAIAAHARAGTDFAKLVAAYDNGDSSLRGGAGIGEKAGEIKPAQVESTVLSLRPGEVGPVIDVGFGFHIVKVVERQYAGVKPFDAECQGKIRDKLRGLLAEREYKRIVDDLKRKSTIVVYAPGEAK